MTDHAQRQPTSSHDDAHDAAPLESWMIDLARDASSDVAVPREMMWKRVQRARDDERAHDAKQRRTNSTWRTRAGIAAVLCGGIAIGRYALPRNSNTPGARVAASADSLTMPTRVAMDEHLVRTAALLTVVRDRDVMVASGQDVSAWARDLLGTTRLLLDEPSLRDDRTRQLLQDLELVLMQIAQARGTNAPEARRAPAETMRETNLLPRVRAAVNAATEHEQPLLRGAAE